MDELLILSPTVTSTIADGLMAPLAGASASVSSYLTQANIYVASGAIYLLPILLKRMEGIKGIFDNEWVVRVMPIYPLIMATLFVMLPGGIVLPDQLFTTRLIAIIYTAALSMLAHKFLGQTVLGDDNRIKTFAVESKGQYRPTMVFDDEEP